MKRTLAELQKEWYGFYPTRYSLDLTFLDDRLTQPRNVGGSIEQVPIKVSEIYKNLAGRRIDNTFNLLELKITTDAETLVIEGPHFTRRILEVLLTLRNDGVDFFATEWFWYDCEPEPHGSHHHHSFFVVHDGTIVRDSVVFGDDPSDGFDARIFKTNDHSEPGFLSERNREEASVRWWYRKFYAETRTGQIMALREDKPELYDYRIYCDPTITAHLSQNSLRQLRKVHFLLWVLIALVALVLVRLLS
jgi:hypothetical protein